ncbi:MAG: ECF RNA polymerase sigma factor SigW [candidate division WS6 bacterium OLB20]|uniref:ECF RNA polymerase sigma factor SigW n=1 Tax=candidate division WS6 bacterium OLB20 TaxID=1617426 RepID=A0A136LYJ1_9BACT|nr:MAG: ECF RNA polymerase sigma factor SigW [candidate division WS6 bacterium OLB20]
MERTRELQLVEEAKKNLNAFQELYDYYFDRIYGFCLNRLPLKEHAEDITSQVFIAAVEALPRYDTSTGYRFGTWLYRVAHNKIADFYRRSRLQSIADFNEIIDEHADTESEAYRDDIQQQVVRVMTQLNPRYQEILSYKYYAELESDEIAGLMKIRQQQVKVLLHRALKSFKETFSRMYPETETFSLD